MRRTRGTILLVLAYLMALVAPMRSGWACRDGTPCEAMRAQPSAPMSCCEKHRVLTCKHSGHQAAEEGGSPGARLEAPDHCVFRVSVPPQLIALNADGTGVVHSGEALPEPLTLGEAGPSAGSSRFTGHTLGYRPPPLLESGPSRAPPVG